MGEEDVVGGGASCALDPLLNTPLMMCLPESIGNTSRSAELREGSIRILLLYNPCSTRDFNGTSHGLRKYGAGPYL